MAVAEVTISQLARAAGISAEELMRQLSEAGVDIQDMDQALSKEQRDLFLEYKRRGGSAKSQISANTAEQAVKPSGERLTLNRQKRSHFSLKSAGKKKVTIEVRKNIKLMPQKEAVEAEPESEAVQQSDKVEEKVNQVEAELDKTQSSESDVAQVGIDKSADEEKAGEEKVAQEGSSVSGESKKDKSTSEHASNQTHKKPTKTDAKKPARKSDVDEDELPKKNETKPRNKFANNKERKTAVKKVVDEALKETEGLETELLGTDTLVTEAPVKRASFISEARPQFRSKLLKKHGFSMPVKPQVYEVNIPNTLTVGELAKRMSVKASLVIKTLMSMDMMVTVNQVIEQDTAALVVEELGHQPKLMNEDALELEVMQSAEKLHAQIASRSPVVTIMGHVDHGKTSLLDYIRRAKVASGEAGGITQHIGAYHVTTKNGDITFLDTPGHEAFTAMRVRGTKITDIVVLVVAADDGVKPQTIEAIKHAKAANVPLIVAINKIDKAETDLDRVKTELSQQDVLPEDWGGDVQFIPISALTGEGIDRLLEGINLLAEMLELKSREKGLAEGVVLESRLDKGRGVVTTVLVQHGQLKRGDILLVGTTFGKVRAMLDESNAPLKVAGPSIPVQVLGLSEVPQAGDTVIVVENERKAREVSAYRIDKERETRAEKQVKASLNNLFDNLSDGEQKEFTILLKTDVQGSLEAITEALQKIVSDEVTVKIVASGVGAITESDVNLAMASKAIIFGFNVRADSAAKRLIEAEGVGLHYYSVIYEIVDEVKKVVSGMLSPEIKENIIGVAEVRDIFRSPKFGDVAGCMVVEGMVKRTNPIRVLRDNVVIYEGTLESLRRFKEDAAEVKQGYECGIAVKNYNDVRVGDQIEVYERIEVAREI